MALNTDTVTIAAQVVPSGPKPSSLILGHLPDLRKDALGLMLRISRDYRPVTKLRLIGTFYVLHEPADIHHVLVTEYKKYRRSTQVERLKPIVGEGLIASEGERWRQQRKLAQPAFHKERIARAVATIARVAQEGVAAWDALPNGSVIDVSEEMSRTALRVIGLAMFDYDLAERSAAVSGALETILEVTIDRLRRLLYTPGLPTAKNLRFDRAMRILHDVVEGIITARTKENVDRGDLLSMFMRAVDAETGARMDERQLRDEVMTMVLVGHETTAHAMAWTFALLNDHPEVRRRLREEAKAVLGDRPATFEDVRKLTYARQVLMESMRLRPPAWMMARTALVDDTLPSGVKVPKGTQIFISPYSVHRDPAHWPNPERFDPERFSDTANAARLRGTYIPFGAGPRKCIGDEFAMTEAVVVIASIARRYELLLPPGHVVVEQPSVTLRPKHGLPMILTRV